jgi:hypothetical protein
MSQTTIFDFLDTEKPDDSLMERFQSIFPGYEILGYVKEYEWGKNDDYALVVERDGICEIVHAELYHDGQDQKAYGRRRDFEPHWFEWHEKRGRHWVWRSLEDRNRVYEMAMKNQKEVG